MHSCVRIILGDKVSNEYIDIVNSILENKKFCKLKEEKHHENSNRFNHNIEVSFKTYKICKRLKLNYKAASRAALLHDFFFNSDFNNKRESLFKHGKKAIDNSLEITSLTKKEKDIISSHMFPVGGTLPKNIESIIVLLVDDYVSVKEKFGFDIKYIKEAFNFMFTIILTIILR